MSKQNGSNKNTLSIGFLIQNLSKGGAQRVISNLSRTLSESFDIKLILFDGKEIDYPYRGEIIDLNIKRGDHIIGRFRKLFESIIKINNLKSETDIDILFSFLNFPNILNLLFPLNEKKIISVRNTTSQQTKNILGFIYSNILKILYHRSYLIIACSKYVKKDLIENFNIDRSMIEVIPNLYNIDEIERLSKQPLEDDYKEIFENPVIINVGSLSYQKGQQHLIKTFKILKNEIPNANLVILGEGNLKNELKELCLELNLRDDVYFLGFQKNPYKYVKNSTVFALSSLYEGFPNVLLESMVCGTPVVSTDCPGGSREILAPDTDISKKTKKIEYAKYGILTPPFERNDTESINDSSNEKLFAEAILKLIRNKKIRKTYSLKSKERSNNFRADKIAQKWRALIGQIS